MLMTVTTQDDRQETVPATYYGNDIYAVQCELLAARGAEVRDDAGRPYNAVLSDNDLWLLIRL